jgi:hypothetical protein
MSDWREIAGDQSLRMAQKMLEQQGEVNELTAEVERLRGESVLIFYTNHRGERTWRKILPRGIRFAATEWHPEPQWLLDATDLERGVERSFAMQDIREWARGELAARTGEREQFERLAHGDVWIHRDQIGEILNGEGGSSIADSEVMLRGHSVTLNAVAFKLAEALGDIPSGRLEVEGNPVELADRMIAERDSIRASLDCARDRSEMMAYQRGAVLAACAAQGETAPALAARVEEIFKVGMVVEVKAGYDEQLAAVTAERDRLRGDAADAVQVVADLTSVGDVMPEPCQPIGCDNGYHVAGCIFAEVDAGDADKPPSDSGSGS